jgi:hypothetical protein
MALGNNYDNNKKDQYMPVYYSAYNTGNPEGIDPSALSYSFYNRMLKISISPVKMNSGDKVSYDHENAASVWLTHTKARLFYEEIKKVLNGEIANGGVPTGTEGLIRFCDGKELGVNNYCLIINKVNEAGEVTSSYAYEFKTKHHYAVENYDPKDSSHKKVYFNNLEIQQLLDMLEQYYIAMTGAMAYSVMDANRFMTNTNNTKIDLIMSKMGIDFKPGTTSRSSGSFFDNNNGASSESDRSMRAASMDDLD